MQIRPSYRSLKYHLVVMLSARINVIQPQIRKSIMYLLPLPHKKKTTAVVKRDEMDRTETIVKHDRLWSAHFLSEKVQLSIVFCCYGCVWRFLDYIASHDYIVYEIMSVCMCVKQQTDDLYTIICKCIYNVVINCGWNNKCSCKNNCLLALKCIYIFIMTR